MYAIIIRKKYVTIGNLNKYFLSLSHHFFDGNVEIGSSFQFVFYPAVVDCGTLMASPPLQVTLINTTFNSTATYSCQVGYNLVGNSERICQANRSYSGVEPSCMSELSFVGLWTLND